MHTPDFRIVSDGLWYAVTRVGCSKPILDCIETRGDAQDHCAELQAALDERRAVERRAEIQAELDEIYDVVRARGDTPAVQQVLAAIDALAGPVGSLARAA